MSETAPTIEEVRALRDQLEERIFEVVVEFEDLTGILVERIDISRERKIGFGAVDIMTVDVIPTECRSLLKVGISLVFRASSYYVVIRAPAISDVAVSRYSRCSILKSWSFVWLVL